MKTQTWAALGLGAALLMAGGGVAARRWAARRAAARIAAAVSAAAAHGGVVLRIPHVTNAITLDGDTDDPGWLRPPGPARTHGFLLRNGETARPYSEARAVWGDGYLYVTLYAADEDIESRTDKPDGPLWLDDAFRVVFSRPGVQYAIDVSPKAIITDSMRKGAGEWDYSWSSGAHASQERDGTLNHPDDMDEEWVIELAVPLDSIGMKGEAGEAIGMTLSRCDTPKGAPRICAGWGAGWGRSSGTIVLE